MYANAIALMLIVALSIVVASIAPRIIALAKDDPRLPLHAWCVKGTPQWRSCKAAGDAANKWYKEHGVPR